MIDGSTVALLGFVHSSEREAVEKTDGLKIKETIKGDVLAIIAEDFDPNDPLESLTNVHEKLVSLAQDASILPVRVGTMVPNGEVIADLNHVESLMRRISGRVEARISGSYDEDKLLDAISDRVPRTTADAKDRIDLGKKVASEIDAQRAKDQGRIEAVLSPIIDDHRTKPVGDAKLCEMSVLLDRGAVTRLDKTLKSLVEEEMPYARFRIIAPLPAYSFVC